MSTSGTKCNTTKRNTQSKVLFGLVNIAAIITFAVLCMVLAYVLIKGIPALLKNFKDLFALKYTTDNCSLLPSIWLNMPSGAASWWQSSD